jgi:L-fucose isomerase-like protein
LAGLLAHTAALTGMGRRFTFVYGLPDSEEARKQLDRFIRTILVRRALRWAKIALVGCDSPGSFAGASDRLGIKNLFGSEIQHVALSTLLEQIRTLTDKEIEEDVRELRSADYVVEVSDLHAVRRSCTAYSAVKKILVQGGFAAAAIKCRPELIDVHKLGMYAVCSQLTDSGMPANCDGDVDAALTMLIQHAYTGRPPFCANWIQRDDKTNQVLFWSGGSAPASLINPKFQPRITDGSPVRENVAFDFPLKTGDVTAARLCWHAGRCKLLVARGRAVEPPAPVKGTHVSIRFEAPVQALLGAILKHGFPQGYCIVYEDIKDEMIELADQLGIEAISPEPGEL